MFRKRKSGLLESLGLSTSDGVKDGVTMEKSEPRRGKAGYIGRGGESLRFLRK